MQRAARRTRGPRRWPAPLPSWTTAAARWTAPPTRPRPRCVQADAARPSLLLLLLLGLNWGARATPAGCRAARAAGREEPAAGRAGGEGGRAWPQAQGLGAGVCGARVVGGLAHHGPPPLTTPHVPSSAGVQGHVLIRQQSDSARLKLESLQYDYDATQQKVRGWVGTHAAPRRPLHLVASHQISPPPSTCARAHHVRSSRSCWQRRSCWRAS